MNKRINLLAVIAFALVVLLISVSAYIRLAQGGLGCTPWPGCYAMLDDAPQVFPIATVLHRLSAGALGILAVLLTIDAFLQRKQRGLMIAVLAVTILLAALGIRSGGLLLPAVVLGNFLGGLVLAILLGWLVIHQFTAESESTSTHAAVLIVLALVVATIVTGIGSSAFYGNTACKGLFDCGTLQSPLHLTPFAPLTLNATGHAVAPDGAATLQQLHRLLGAAAAVALMLFIFAMFSLQSHRNARPSLIMGLIVALTAAATGLIATRHGLPISAAVIHSLSGLFLVLMLLRTLRRR